MRDATAAQVIRDAWLDGRTIAALPEDCRPRTIDEGYAVQARLNALVGPRRGWKIAATSAEAQSVLDVDHPLIGPLYEGASIPDGGDIDLARTTMRLVEAEFGFIMATDLPARDAPYDRDEVVAALGPFVPALEIPDTRYDDLGSAGGPQLVADATCAAFHALGPPVADYDPDALSRHSLTLTTADGTTYDGDGSKVLGDPIEPLLWLANALSQRGEGLAAGEAVITGAVAIARDPAPGPAVADFGSLGRVSVVVR